jgi:hypothetical protein
MTTFAIETTVRLTLDKKKAFGVVKNHATLTPTGPVVTVKLLPDFAHLMPTGWVDMAVADLTEVRLCACAHLAYRPTYGDRKDELFTTGCDFSRMPGRGRSFLPGHDAKAKGFLVKAAFATSTLENGKGALETAREFGDKIAMAVAGGIDKERARNAKRSGKTLTRLEESDRPATREDELSEAQKLQRLHRVTDPMIRALAIALAQNDGRVAGNTPTGTVVAMQTRGLVSWGNVTDLGRAVMDFAELEADKVECKDDAGSYTSHTSHRSGCRRCGADFDADQH